MTSVLISGLWSALDRLADWKERGPVESSLINGMPPTLVLVHICYLAWARSLENTWQLYVSFILYGLYYFATFIYFMRTGRRLVDPRMSTLQTVGALLMILVVTVGLIDRALRG